MSQSIKEQICYFQGKQQTLMDLYTFIKEKTNMVNDNLSAIDILDNFLKVNSDLNEKELEKIKMLIPTQN